MSVYPTRYRVQGELSEAKLRQAEKDAEQSRAARDHLAMELERRNTNLARTAADAMASSAQLEAQLLEFRSEATAATNNLNSVKENHKAEMTLLQRKLDGQVCANTVI